MRKEEPSPAEPNLQSAMFYLGRDSRGRWVAQDAGHRRGGLFISRAAALKYALSENGYRPEAVIAVPGAIELDFGTVTRTYRRAA